jgi:hypothetical protein
MALNLQQSIRLSFRSQIVYVVQKILTTQKIVVRDAQLDLAPIMQKLYNEILILEVEASPKLTYAVAFDYHYGFVFSLLENAQTCLVDHSNLLLPTPEKRRFTHFSTNLCAFELLLSKAQLGSSLSVELPSHKLKLKSNNFGENVVVVVKKELVDLFGVDREEYILVIFVGDLHFQASALSSAEKQLHLGNVVER